MPRYFFDYRDGELSPDPDGTELDGDEAAQYQAALALAELAKERLPGSVHRRLEIEVRNERRRHLFTAILCFDVSEDHPEE